MCLDQRNVVVVIDGSAVDRALGGQAAAAELVDEGLTKEVHGYAQTVRWTEVVVHSPVVGILGISLRIEKGQAADLIGQTGRIGASSGFEVCRAVLTGPSVIATSGVRSYWRISGKNLLRESSAIGLDVGESGA